MNRAHDAADSMANWAEENADADRVFWIYTLCGLSVWALVITIWAAGS